jgi:hypothetical protein
MGRGQRDMQGFAEKEKAEGRAHLERLGVDGKTELKQRVKKRNGRTWTGFIWLTIGTIGGLL